MVKVLSQKEFQEKIVTQYTDVIGEKLGGKVLKFSDEWFAEAENLIKPKAPIFDANKFVPAGKWYDGWKHVDTIPKKRIMLLSRWEWHLPN